MNTNSTSVICACASASTGISRMQGGHQVAQRLITKGFPCRLARLTSRPSRVMRVWWGREGRLVSIRATAPEQKIQVKVPAATEIARGRRSEDARQQIGR